MRKRTANEPSLGDIQERLRAAGLRSTGARVAVMQQLLRASSPVSHAEVARDLAGRGFDRATVYRNLVDLAEAGLVRRSELGDHVWRFELRREDAHEQEHPHFVCIDCGDVSCLPSVSIQVSGSKTKKPAGVGEILEILLKGRCSACV